LLYLKTLEKLDVGMTDGDYMPSGYVDKIKNNNINGETFVF
jgi:hypothetical protein